VSVGINQLETGMGLLIDNVVYVILDIQHVKPGKGAAFARVKVRNLKTDQVLERTFRSADKLDDVILEERRLQNQYRAGDMIAFMDMTTFEETQVPADMIGDAIRFLQDNLEVSGMFVHGKLMKVTLPNFIETQITHSEPGIKGDSSKSGTKPAVIDTGATVQVPLFINEGEWIKLDTRTGTYIERVRK
jgi:elongation factor P